MRGGASPAAALDRALLPRAAGVQLSSDHDFPIQTLPFDAVQGAWRAAIQLRQQGVWAVLQLNSPDRPGGGALRFILTADHTESDLDYAARAVAATMTALQLLSSRS